MTSVIPAFSLFVLVLVSGCFTLPFVDRSSTLSSFNDDVTTEKIFVSDSTPELELRELSGEYRGFNMPTSTGHYLPEDISQASYMGHEHSASERFTIEPTTERIVAPKRDAKDSYAVDEPIPSERFTHTLTEKFDTTKVGAADSYAVDESIPSERFEHHPTVEGFVAPKRAHDELFMTEVESNTEAFDHVTRSSEMDFEMTSEFTPEKRFFDDASFGTTEQTIQNGESHFKTDLTTEFIKTKMDMEPTTDFMTTFTSTIAPEVYTTKLYPSTFTSTMSTEKFTGHLDDEEEHEKPEKTRKVSKYDKERKPKTTTVEPEDDSHIRVAEFDQSALDKLTRMPNDLMVLDNKNDVVTNASIKLTTDIMKNEPKEKLLNQGKKPSHIEEKESDH